MPAGEAAQAVNDRPPLSQDAIRALIADVEAAANLETAVREQFLADLRAALEATQRRETVRSEQSAFAEAAEEAPATIERLRAELSQPPAPVQVEAPEGATLEDIRQSVVEASADLEAARAEAQRLTTEVSTRATRLDEIPRQLAELRTRQAELQPRNGVALEDASLQERVTIAKRRAERALVEAQIQRLESEQASYRARQELLPLRRDRAQRRVDTAARVLEQWQNIESSRLQAEAAERQREAQRLQREAALLSPTLSAIAEQNQAFAALRTGEEGILSELAEMRERKREAENSFNQLRNRVTGTIAKVDATGLSDSVGVLLRNELKNLPEDGSLRDEKRDLQRSLGDAQYQLIIIEERLGEVRDVGSALPGLVESVTAANPDVDPKLVEDIGRELLQNQAALLSSLREEFGDFIEDGAELDALLASYGRLAESYRSFIEERVLWTRSVPGQRLPRVNEMFSATMWLISWDNWRGAIDTVLRNLWPPRPLVVMLVLLLAVSVVVARRARTKLHAIAGKVRKFNTDKFIYSVEAVPLTVLIAAPYPLLAMLLASLLSGGDEPFTRALSSAFVGLGVTLTIIEFVRHAVRPNGIADAHFRWPKDGLADFRRWVFTLEITMVPILLVGLLMNNQPNELWGNSLGRVAFILGMLVLSAFYGTVFAPWRVFARPHLEKHPNSLLAKSKWFWYPLAIGLPLTLAVLALAGFFYTATELNTRVRLSMWLLAGIVLVHCLVLRWLLVERRKMLVARAKQKREAAAAAAASAAGDGGESASMESPPDAMDVPDIDVQTRRVVSAVVITTLLLGMYTMWADVLPALKMFQRVQVFPQVTVLEEVRTDMDALLTAASAEPVTTSATPPTRTNGNANGNGGANANGAAPAEPAPPASNGGMTLPGMPPLTTGVSGGGGEASGQQGNEPALGIVTLNDIAIALIIVLFTVVLSRNLPGLLEITLLKRLPLDAGARFAISAVLRYALVVVGVLLAFAAIGVSWNKVQWLVAALTFGLAFGLQEIFANFISGLIMFAERPVRVGDTVTVAGISGTVTQIRMRATTVRDWDYKELVIPNKTFITDQVINWTLADQRIRVVIPVGVSYGADVRLVQRTLLEIADRHDNIVSDPAPMALFMGFGDSTLNFELRCFLPNLSAFLGTRSELHMRITERFRELGIEIAFPQRDLHIRSADPIRQMLAERQERSENTANELPPAERGA